MTKIENRISLLEDDQPYLMTSSHKIDKNYQVLVDKIEDLENRSPRKIIRMVGLPNSYAASSLLELCKCAIPFALGMKHSCMVKRAHRLGQPHPKRTSLRPIIANFLNCQKKIAILQQFRRAGSMRIERHKLLMFADYSQEVSRKRDFSQICATLHSKHIKFTLAYPATLYVQASIGVKMSFTTPID